jgi:tetratricopeptide (TPR) repeat protein
MGKDKEAADCYALAAGSYFFDPKFVASAGALYEKLGKKAEAIKLYNDYLRFYPDDKAIKDRVTALQTGKPVEKPAAAAPAATPTPATPGAPAPIVIQPAPAAPQPGPVKK